jgi:hypothetical protein
MELDGLIVTEQGLLLLPVLVTWQNPGIPYTGAL